MRYYNWLYIGLAALVGCGQDEPVPAQPTVPVIEVVEEVKTPETTYVNIPERAMPYIYLIDIEGDNPSWFAALVDTESHFSPFAESPSGAFGLTQIMPSNYEWLENGMCSHLGRAKPENPEWQMECGQILFEWGGSWNKNPPPMPYCEMQYIKSMLFNGGYYVWWEYNYGGQTLDGAKNICGTLLPNGRKRSKGSCIENYNYPVTISKKQNLFLELGGEQCLINSSYLSP